MTAKKLYTQTLGGGIKFSSGRKPGEVRIPNYVYDLWLPLIGTDALTVYAVYCRLEREDTVKAITLDTIAKCCRIGKATLYKANSKLQECGFIVVKSPQGNARAHHHTTEITVNDPPQEIKATLIEKYKADSGYEPLSKWLVINPTDVPDRTSRSSEQNAEDVPDRTSTMLQPSVLQPSSVEEKPDEIASIIKAWLDGQTTQPVTNQYGNKGVRSNAKALVGKFTPEQITAYVKVLAAQPYWSGKLVTIGYVANNIAAHYAANKPAAINPAHVPFDPAEIVPDAIPMPPEAQAALQALVKTAHVNDEVTHAIPAKSAAA